jgi:hypothetical protein
MMIIESAGWQVSRNFVELSVQKCCVFDGGAGAVVEALRQRL